MQCDWMQWIPCSLVKCILFECRGFLADWLNAVYSMQHEEMEPYWMRGSLCSIIECSGFLQNNLMLWILCSMAESIPIECSDAAWNALHSITLHGIHCIKSGYFRPCCIKSTAFNLDAFGLAAWTPLHTIVIHFATMNGILCIQSCCMESTAFNQDALGHAA